MNNLQIFENAEFGKVRTVLIDTEPWFVAKDVCDVLELSNPTMALQRLDSDEVTKFNLGGLSGETNIVNEYGLYSLVIGSRKAEAKAFKRWITHDVIPAIRQTGFYGNIEYMVPKTFAQALQLAANLQLQIEEQSAKVLFADSVAGSKGACLIGELAKIIKQKGVDMGQNRLFQWMREQGYLGKLGGNYNLPTQKSMELGVFEIKKTVVTHASGDLETRRTAKVTGKGQIYFVDKLCRDRKITALL